MSEQQMYGVLYNHEIYCNTECEWVRLWKTDASPLVACPRDPAHEGLPMTANVLMTRESGKFYELQEPQQSLMGKPRLAHRTLTVAPGASANHVFRHPFPVHIYKFSVQVPPEAVGVRLTADSRPHTLVGAARAPSEAGETVLRVTPTVAANAKPGLLIGNHSTGASYGYVTSVDATLGNETVTLGAETPLAAPVVAGTLLDVSLRMCDSLPLLIPGMRSFGDERRTAVPFEANVSVLVTIENPTANPVTVVVEQSFTC
jgi:hypothetical protein